MSSELLDYLERTRASREKLILTSQSIFKGYEKEIENSKSERKLANLLGKDRRKILCSSPLNSLKSTVRAEKKVSVLLAKNSKLKIPIHKSTCQLTPIKETGRPIVKSKTKIQHYNKFKLNSLRKLSSL